MTEPRPLITSQKPVNNLTNDERCKRRHFVRRVEQFCQSHDRIEQIGTDRADIHRAHIRITFFSDNVRFHHYRGDDRRIKVHPKTQIRLFFGGFDCPADDRQSDG
jgi:hypothetical protein